MDFTTSPNNSGVGTPLGKLLVIGKCIAKVPFVFLVLGLEEPLLRLLRLNEVSILTKDTGARKEVVLLVVLMPPSTWLTTAVITW